MGGCESAQQHVGGDSSETESHEPRGGSQSGERPVPQLPEWDGAAKLPHQPTHTLRALQGAMRLEDVPVHRDPTCSAGSPTSDANLPGPSLAVFSLLPPWHREGVPRDLTLDTHHSGPGAIVGLDDGEPQGCDPHKGHAGPA